MNKKFLYILGGLIIIIFGRGFFLFQEEKDEPLEITDISDFEDSGGSVEVVPILEDGTEIAFPDLDREVFFAENTPDDYRIKMEENIRSLQDELKKNNRYLDGWINLGLHYKEIGDYKGAEEAWLYAGFIGPAQSVSFGNLGVLYGYYIHDNEKAEKYLLKAIEISPKDLYLYQQAADFFREGLRDPVKERKILEDAIANAPTEADAEHFRVQLEEL